jgi:hypothetical protein
MTEKQISTNNQSSTDQQHQKEKTGNKSTLRWVANLWKRMKIQGLDDPIIRIGTHIVTISVVVVVVVALSSFYLKNVRQSGQDDLQATAMAIAAPTLNAASGISAEEAALGITFPIFQKSDRILSAGIPRLAEPKTVIPSRPRVDVITYEVQQGDNVFTIADQFGLRPETILWGNYAVLQDNPRLLTVGQILNILPVDGTYHKYSTGETLDAIAKNYNADVQDILEWPGNHLDPYETDINNPGIADGTWLIIPGGSRELQDWGPPAITRENPASAAYYGEGSCGDVYSGAVGNGTFIWPTGTAWISGYDYDANIHPAIDIGGTEGDAIYAVDSGVVVYAGWSNYGYGYLIVIDHGTGWQSAYAHLSGVGVYCGQSVAQGDVIGALGSTGNSSGPHLHFELTSEIYGKVNPHDFLALP